MPKNPPPSPSSGSPRGRRFLAAARSRVVLSLLLAAGVALAGYLAGRAGLVASGAVEAVQGRVKLRPGPWGDVEYLPITIAAPRRLLRVQGLEDEPIAWYFPGMTRASWIATLDELGVRGAVREALASPRTASEHPEGVRVMPACDAVEGLGDSARRSLYELLQRHPENGGQRWEFQEKYVEASSRFGVTRATTSLVRKTSVRHGRYLVNYALSCVLARVTDPEEKSGLVKALSQQSSMLVRLKVSPRTDVAALAAYWGRGMWSTDTEAILESIRKRPDGGSISLLELLPPLPASLLHGYPVPHNFMAGPEVVKNCSWTALNFFRDEPVAAFAGEGETIDELARNYHPVLSDPQYGDVAVFLTPERTMRHVAVFLADDLYFTKNGDNPWHPWVYATLSDLVEEFSFGLGEGEVLTVHYFRSKGY